ncbi:MAG TPA: GNAT family N-acetyltransferase [Casimicrobiaceae bacterium]|nr:GNAT family N-acetyltransferase [Casimicrobiaceae bacterium]
MTSGHAAVAERAGAVVALCEITAGTVRDYVKLDVGPEQNGLVAPNAVSIAEAYFEPAAWFRGIRAGDTPVGFAMLYDPTRTSEPDDPGACYLWRFMIDHAHQRRGYGAAALDLLIAHVRTLPGVDRFKTSYVDRPGNASPLYVRKGFVATGELDEDEIVLQLLL